MVQGDLVEFVAVHQHVALLVGGNMHVAIGDDNAAELHAVVFPQCLVMIARNQHDPVAAPCSAQNFLNHGILCGRPCQAATHRPEIDDIADQEQIFGFVFLQEFQQAFSLTCPRSQMNIGDKD